MKKDLLAKIKERYKEIPIESIKQNVYNKNGGVGVIIEDFPYKGISLYYNRTNDGQPHQGYLLKFLFEKFEVLDRKGLINYLEEKLKHPMISSVIGGYVYSQKKFENDDDCLAVLEYCVSEIRKIIAITLPLVPKEIRKKTK